MSKNKNNIDEQNEDQPTESGSPASASDPQPTESGSPAFITDLLNNGTTVLTAKTRDELSEMVNNIPADCSYTTGAVGRNYDTGMFTLRIDLTNKEK